MTLELSDWDIDLPKEKDEEYQAFVQTLRFTDGFALLFVRCSPAGSQELISKVKEDIHEQNIEVLKLDQDITNLYETIDKLEHKEQINILFITGLESSLSKYEEAKTLVGWSSRETHHYSWKDVPPLLININQQRERFRDSFKICFVFLLPKFAIKYFIHRAPDFFDWRSGSFDFPLDSETLTQESTRIIQEGTYEKYTSLTHEETNQKIIEIQELITDTTANETKAELFFELGYLHNVRKDYQAAISSYDKAVEFKPDYHQAWYNRGNSLDDLGRYEEAISSYDKAVEFKPDYHQAWYNRGNSLDDLGRYEEAISSYDKAVEFKPDDHEAWYNRGISLDNLGRYEEAISSYDKAVEFKPDYYQAWNNWGISLDNLGRYEAAISSYDKAVEFKPDDHKAWYNRGNSLNNLGRYEEAISSYDKAVEFKPDYYQAWYNKSCIYALQSNIEQAIENLQIAINLYPEKVREWTKTNSDFDAIREDERFQALFTNISY
ncbi:MAG: tetratricopeptide repeat protein [Dolichospermum sp.]